MVGRARLPGEGGGLPGRPGIIAARPGGRRKLRRILARLSRLPDLERRPSGRRPPGLEGILGLLEALGRPQEGLPLVHLAGSKGKGTTALFLEALFLADGLRTGVYLSPHLSGLEERFRLDGSPLDPDRAAELLDRAAAALPASPEATFFDLLTAAAFLLFREARVEAACLETGLGGRLDSTNAARPRVTVVTGVEREHEDVLGRGLERVAREKAGILEPGVPLVTGCRRRALAVLEERARSLGAPAAVLGRDFRLRRWEKREEGWKVELELLGGGRRVFQTGRLPLPQLWSLALAAQAFAFFRGKDPEERILEAAGRAVLPGRFEILRGRGLTWVLDGAHTARSLARLARDMETWFPRRPWSLLFGVAPDKRWLRAFRLLSSRAVRTWVVDLPGKRRVPAERLAAAAPGKARPWLRPRQALEALAEAAAPGETVLVTGSFRLAGAARTWLLEEERRGDGG